MPISYNNIPANARIPLYYVEVDPSQAGLPIVRQAALLVGSMISASITGPPAIAAGTATPNVPIPVGTQAQADNYYGVGSELALMFRAFFNNNFAHEVWGLAVAEPGGSAAATGTLTVSTPPTEAGTIHLYIGGHHVMANVGATDTTTTVATALKNAINDPDFMSTMPAYATSAAAVVTLTCKTKGTNGNDIDFRTNYYGAIGGEKLPTGLTLAYSNGGLLTGGAGVPDFTIAIANIGEKEFEYVALPLTDSTTLLAWETEYGFSDTGRWGWMRQQFGHLFATKRDTYANLVAFGATRNSGVLSVMGVEKESPSPGYEWTAAYTAKAARALLNDPARPLQTLSLNLVKPAPLHQRFDWLELNTLAGSGIATQKTGADNQPMIARETTMYQLNLYSQSDDAYELVTTLATLAKLLRNQRHAITSKFPRHKLANDGTRFGAGQAIVTPKIIKAELVAQYRFDEFMGLVEDAAAFKAHLIVERDPTNPNRLNVLYPPDLVNQLRIFAVLAQFRLQYNRGQDLEVAA
jgi:phage tail sheath gpL-like